MTFEEIRTAIEERFAGWTGPSIQWDNMPPIEKPYDQPWVRLTIQHGASTAASVASAPEVRRTGIIDVQVFTPESHGTGEAHRLADQVVSLLQFYRSGHLETMASSVERVGKEEDWYNLLVSTPFRAGC